jgi:hypothetical protein
MARTKKRVSRRNRTSKRRGGIAGNIDVLANAKAFRYNIGKQYKRVKRGLTFKAARQAVGLLPSSLTSAEKGKRTAPIPYGIRDPTYHNLSRP